MAAVMMSFLHTMDDREVVAWNEEKEKRGTKLKKCIYQV